MAKLASPTTQEFAPAKDVESYGLQSLGKLAMASPMDTVLRDKAGYNLAVYRDLHREPAVKSAFQQRRSAVISCERKLLPGDENDPRSVKAAEELEQNLDALDMDGILKDMLFGVLMGYSVAQLVWDPDMAPGRWWWRKILRHKQEYFRFDYDGNLYQITRQAPQGQPWPAESSWVFRVTDGHTDDPYGTGLGHHLFWSVFFRRNAHRFWQVYLEKYAAPTAIAIAPPNVTDVPTERQKVLEMLQAIRRDAGVIVPKGIEVSLLEATRAGQVDYKTMIDVVDAEITTTILSQQLTTASQGGQYKAEVQERVKDDVIKEDADLLCSSFNAGPARRWTDYNFGPEVASPKLWIETEPPEDINRRAERDAKIYALGFEPTEDYINETYGEGWVKKQEPEPVPGTPGAAKPPGGLPSFAELGTLADALGGHDGDQIRIKEAAIEFARKYREQFGAQVAELLAYAESAQDFATFQKHLQTLARQAPPQEQVDTLKNAGIVARLLGIRRQQR